MLQIQSKEVKSKHWPWPSLCKMTLSYVLTPTFISIFCWFFNQVWKIKLDKCFIWVLNQNRKWMDEAQALFSLFIIWNPKWTLFSKNSKSNTSKGKQTDQKRKIDSSSNVSKSNMIAIIFKTNTKLSSGKTWNVFLFTNGFSRMVEFLIFWKTTRYQNRFILYFSSWKIFLAHKLKNENLQKNKTENFFSDL